MTHTHTPCAATQINDGLLQQELMERAGLSGGRSPDSGATPAARNAITLAAAALEGATHATWCFEPSLLQLLAKNSGPAAAASAPAPSGASVLQGGGAADEVEDCCCYLLRL